MLRVSLLRVLRPLFVVGSFSLLVGGITGGCIGVSAKPAATAPLGAASALKRCRAVRPADDGAVDDLEDANNQITKTAGRDGYWWSAADPKGSKIEMETVEPGAGGSEIAMHMKGTTVPGFPIESPASQGTGSPRVGPPRRPGGRPPDRGLPGRSLRPPTIRETRHA